MMEGDATLLSLLRCPVTGQTLRAATTDEVAGGRKQADLSADLRVMGEFTDGLTTNDGTLFYPVIQDIPVLIPDAAVTLPPDQS